MTNAYLGTQDIWPLNDGTGATQATDAGNNGATLAGTITRATDSTASETVLQLDGATGHTAPSWHPDDTARPLHRRI